ncbi:MAG: hypothetical protein LUQ37_01075, partial [Methanoregulaceae archaeon]|nr:hypothetical protein [Methanoregulaceae archaeon]
GSHTVLIKEEGYADWQIAEEVKSGQTTQISATLSPLSTPTEGGLPAVLAVIGLLALFVAAKRR